MTATQTNLRNFPDWVALATLAALLIALVIIWGLLWSRDVWRRRVRSLEERLGRRAADHVALERQLRRQAEQLEPITRQLDQLERDLQELSQRPPGRIGRLRLGPDGDLIEDS